MTRGRLVSFTKACAVAAVTMITTAASAQEIKSREELNAAVAQRFAAMEKLSARLSTPEAAGKLIDILMARDADAFNGLLGGLDLPLTGTCWWAHELVERAFETETEKTCFLKEDMTPAERQLYLMLALQYGQLRPGPYVATGTPAFETDRDGRVQVPNGPFADALEAAGLAQCTPAKTSSIASRPIVGEPFYFCLEDARPR